jgi:hypothetical protein
VRVFRLDSRYEPMSDFCEHGDGPSGFINSREFLD